MKKSLARFGAFAIALAFPMGVFAQTAATTPAIKSGAPQTTTTETKTTQTQTTSTKKSSKKSSKKAAKTVTPKPTPAAEKKQ